MSFIAVGATVGTLGAAYMGSQASKKAAKAGQGAADAAAAESARQYDQSREDMMPWLSAGQWGLQQQQNLLSDPSALENNAQYKFLVDQGFKGLNNSGAASGNLWGGGMDSDRMRLGQGLAGQQMDSMLNRYAALSSPGQQAAGSLGGLGSNFANQQADAAYTGANARISGYQNNANIWGSALGQLSNIGGQYMQARPSGPSAGAASGGMGAFGNNLDNFKGWY